MDPRCACAVEGASDQRLRNKKSGNRGSPITSGGGCSCSEGSGYRQHSLARRWGNRGRGDAVLAWEANGGEYCRIRPEPTQEGRTLRPEDTRRRSPSEASQPKTDSRVGRCVHTTIAVDPVRSRQRLSQAAGGRCERKSALPLTEPFRYSNLWGELEKYSSQR